MEEGSHLDLKMLMVVELVVSPSDHRTPMVVESVVSPPGHRTRMVEAMADDHLGPMMLMDLGDR